MAFIMVPWIIGQNSSMSFTPISPVYIRNLFPSSSDFLTLTVFLTLPTVNFSFTPQSNIHLFLFPYLFATFSFFHIRCPPFFFHVLQVSLRFYFSFNVSFNLFSFLRSKIRLERLVTCEANINGACRKRKKNWHWFNQRSQAIFRHVIFPALNGRPYWRQLWRHSWLVGSASFF